MKKVPNIIIRDNKGEIFDFNMREKSNAILEVHYSESYIQFVCQEWSDEYESYRERDLCYILENNNPIDLMAIKDDEICEIIECSLK